jgi:hypothetical protein
MREMLIKSGTIDLTKIGIDGALPEAAARDLIDLAVAEEDFLALVNVQRGDEERIPIDNYVLDAFVLQNLPEGVEPETFSTGSNRGKFIECKPSNAFMEVYYSTIRSSKGKKALQKFDKDLAKNFGSNIIQVAFQGQSYSATSTSVATINKGWVKRLKDSADSQKVDVGPFISGTTGKTGWVEYLTAVVAALPDMYKDYRCHIFMNPADHEEYTKELGALTGESIILINSGVNKFMGYPIKDSRYMARNELIFTNPKNLLVGIQSQIERKVEDKPLARKVNYLFTLPFGFEIGLYEAAVIAYDVTPGDNPSVPLGAPADLSLTDVDYDAGEISGTLGITKATSEADITHYRIYLGTTSAKKTKELATLPKTGSNLVFEIPANTVVGTNTHIYVYAVNAIGEAATPAGLAITDADAVPVPANAPAAVSFTDTDETENELGGTVSVTKASSETDVTDYELYFGTSATVKTTKIATLPKTGGNLTFILPDGTAKGTNTHILAYTKNAYGLCAVPAAHEITDNTGS